MLLTRSPVRNTLHATRNVEQATAFFSWLFTKRLACHCSGGALQQVQRWRQAYCGLLHAQRKCCCPRRRLRATA